MIAGSTLGDTLGGLGSAVGDLFGGIAGFSEANAYKQASQIDLSNEQLAETATKLQETAAARQSYQTIGAQKAVVSGAGFAAGGSALDLLRSSTQQAALTQGTLAVQGAITAQGYAEKAAAEQGQAAAAQAKGTGGILGGLLKGAAALIGL